MRHLQEQEIRDIANGSAILGTGGGGDPYLGTLATIAAIKEFGPPAMLEASELADDALVDKYNFFIFEVVKAHVAPTPRHPQTLHYTGDGVFMVAGKIISRRSRFRPELLDD